MKNQRTAANERMAPEATTADEAHVQLDPPRCSGRLSFESLLRCLGVTTEARHGGRSIEVPER